MPGTARSRPTTRRRHRPVLWLVVVPSVAVAVLMAALYFVVLPLFPVVHEHYFPQSTRTYATYWTAIDGHIAFGTLALALGPVVLLNALRGRTGRWHRRAGGAYAVAVAVSAPCAAVMAVHAYPGTIAGGRFLITGGMLTLAAVWLGTLVAAVTAVAVRGDRERHAFWVIVNISAVYSAVWFRVLNGVLLVTGTFDQLYPVLGWLGWVPSVAVGVWLARRWTARRARAQHRRVTPAPVLLVAVEG